MAGFSIGGSLTGGLSGSSSSSRSVSRESGSSSSELSGLTTTQRFDEQAKALLDALTNRAFDEQTGDPSYTREKAIADAQGMIQNIFKEYQETALPEIYGAQRQTGAYNSTAGQMLANDAFGEAVSRSAQVVQKNIIDYAQLAQGERQLQSSILLDALKLQGSAYESTDLEQKASSQYSGTSSTNTRGSSRSWGLGTTVSGSFGL